MNTTRNALKQAIDKYMTQARDHGLTPAGSGVIRGPLNDTLNALDALDNARDLVTSNPHLSPEGKRDQLAKLDANTREIVESHLGIARQRLNDARKRHEAKTQLPPVVGADLALARHDVDRLTAKVQPGELHDRLEHAARNGGDAVADLLLRDNYAERVVLPAAGSRYEADAHRWAATRRALIAERLGPDGVPHLRALEATYIAGKAVTIAEHAAATSLGAPTDGAPTFTPIIVMHNAQGGN